MADYIPKSKGEYRTWLENLKERLPSVGPAFGLSPDDVGAVTNVINAMITAINAEIAAESALEGARQTGKTTLVATNKFLRDVIGGWKKKSGFLPEHAQMLRVVGTRPDFDADNYKPEFKVKIVGGEIRLDWKKKGVDAVHVYGRLRGEATWMFVAMDTSSPYIDGRPLAQAGVPEVREYMLRGVVDDAEIGLDSDILNITWAGQ